MSTARALQNDLQQATGVNVSDQTIRNRLHEGAAVQFLTTDLHWEIVEHCRAGEGSCIRLVS